MDKLNNMEPTKQENNILAPDVIVPQNYETATGQLEANPFENYGAGVSPVGRQFQSTNFKSGSAGWRLTPSGRVEINGGVPASASAAGIKGTITSDASYIYVCTATNQWKRVAISTW